MSKTDSKTDVSSDYTPMVIYSPTTTPSQPHKDVNSVEKQNPLFEHYKTHSTIMSIIKAGIFGIILTFLFFAQLGNNTELLKGVKMVSEALLTNQREQIKEVKVVTDALLSTIQREHQLLELKNHPPILGPMMFIKDFNNTLPNITEVVALGNGWLFCRKDSCDNLKDYLMYGQGEFSSRTDDECSAGGNLGVYVRPKLTNHNFYTDLPLINSLQPNKCLSFFDSETDVFVFGDYYKK